MALLCPVNEFLKRKDWSIVAQLVSDAGATPPTQVQLLTDANTIAALDSASGDFQAGATAMGRYTDASLAAIASGADSPGQALMFDCVSDLAMMKLYRRKPQLIPDQIHDAWLKALWQAEQLKLGDQTLN
jgi:hypothetical protein